MESGEQESEQGKIQRPVMVEPKKQTFVNRLARRKKASGPTTRGFESPGPMAMPAPTLGESVAIVLQRERRELGRDLNRVAEDLKIRKVYLAAIEEGRFDDLPGSTYAVGFVRAYADYLRLDSEEIITRFKQEVEGLDEHMQLVFPTPAPESKVPGGALILISALLLALAYGGWYALSSDGVNLADWVPEVPKSLRSLGSDDSSETLPESAPESAPDSSAMTSEPSDGSIPPEAADGAMESPESEVAEEAAEEMMEPEVPLEATPSELAPVDEAPGDEALADEAPAPETGSASEPVTETEITESAEPAPEAPEPGSGVLLSDFVAAVETSSPPAMEEPATAAEAIPAEAAEAEPAPAALPSAPAVVAATEIPLAPETEGLLPEAEAREPRTYGAENVSARIVLRARLDSWVQVRDAEDSLLLTRVLRPGDTYRVPNQPGLTLLTGNAGGLQIELDGNAMSPLGPVGAVRRNVALSPERLLDGTAVSR